MHRNRLTSVVGFSLAALVALALAPTAARAEMVENPQYTSWAKHQSGTEVTIKNEMSGQGMTMSQEIRQKLLEVTPDKAVIEMTVVTDMGGQKNEQKQTQDVPSKVTKEQAEGQLPPNVKGTVTKMGKEKVEVAGKSYDCEVTQYEGDGPQGKVTGKTWMTPEIPGMMAKTEMNTAGQSPMKMTLLVTAVSVK